MQKAIIEGKLSVLGNERNKEMLEEHIIMMKYVKDQRGSSLHPT